MIEYLYMTNPFSQIISSIQGFFSAGTTHANSSVGIDIGSSSIKVVQMRNDHGTITLETYGEMALGPYAHQPIGSIITPTPEIIIQALTDIFKESHISGGSIRVALPAYATLVFLMQLPRISEPHLATIIPTEARKYIPIPLTEVSLDWSIIPNKDTYADEESGNVSPIEVLVVAVRNETINEYGTYMQGIHQEKPVYEVEPFSIIRAGLHHEITPVIIIDIGAKASRMIIIEQGIVKIFHVINRGSVFVTESIARTFSIPFEKAEEIKRTYMTHVVMDTASVQQVIDNAHSYFLTEAGTVISQYERESGKTISKILLSGGGSLVYNMDQKFQEHFRIPTQMIQSFEKSQAPESLKPVLSDVGPVFSVAAGLALKDFI